MGTKKEIAELVKLCSYPELQKLWKPAHGQEIFGDWEQEVGIVIRNGNGHWEKFFDCEREFTNIHEEDIWLPRIEDAIRLMGDRFWYLIKDGSKFHCYTGKLGGAEVFEDKSARIACLRALKATLKGG